MARSTTAYNMVAQEIRNRILEGKMQPGQQLPPERLLCEEFGASRITIRRAMQILEEELLVRRQQGQGTFVSAAPDRKIPILSQEFSASLRRHAPDVHRKLDILEGRAADAQLAEEFGGLTGAPLVYVRRIEELDERPVSMDEVWLLERYADRLKPADWKRLDFLDRWRAVQQIELSYSAQVVEAVPAVEPITRLLQVRGGTPLLKESEIIYLTNEEPAARIVSHYRHEYFRLTARVRLPEKQMS